MRIRNKREFLARALRGTGLLGLLERLASRPGLVVLCYHRIGDTATDPFYGPIVSASPSTFTEQIRQLRDRFRIIGLEQLCRMAEDGFHVDGPTALITFDDGYRDNIDLALPILTDLGVPAAFFLTVGFLDRTCLPWWDHVAFVVKTSRRDRLRLDRPEPIDLDLSEHNRNPAMAEVIASYLRADRPDDPSLLEHLNERADVNVAALDPGRSLFMTWDEARRLLDAGMSVGSHTLSHPRLACLTAAEQTRELADSKARIERELSRSIDVLAYPFGLTTDFDATTRRLAIEAGYRLAISLVPGWNRPETTDPMALHRLSVGPADTTVLIRSRVAMIRAFGASFL